MKVSELLEVLTGGIPTIRIIDANAPQDNNRVVNGVMLCEYLDRLSHAMEIWRPFADCEVKHFRVSNEVSHKQYKELGLVPPFKPELTAEYSFADLQVKVYYDIFIDGSTAGDGWKR